MNERYPKIRLFSQGEHLLARDGLTIRFFMHRSHQEFAPAVVSALETFIQAIRPATLGWSPDMEGDWQEADDKAWVNIRKELLEWERQYVTVANRPDGVPEFQFEYTGSSLEHPGPFDEPGRACLATFWLPTEFMEEHGPERVRALALELASFLPFNSGYASLSFNALHQLVGVTRQVARMCFRYPGMDVLPEFAHYDIGTRIPGAYWLTFLGQPVLGHLGGVGGLRARLSSPSTTVQQLGDARAVVALGQWPEAGDLEAGRDLPAYRELARVLEPWLYRDLGRIGGDFGPEDRHRWERRFLD